MENTIITCFEQQPHKEAQEQTRGDRTVSERESASNTTQTMTQTSAQPKYDVVVMKRTEDELIRQTFQIGRQISEEWKEFNRNVPFKELTLEAALRRFMKDVRDGKIRFELKI